MQFTMPRSFATALLLGSLLASPVARADEPSVLSIDGSLGVPIGAPQGDLFGFGGSVGISARRWVAPLLAVGARLDAGAWMDAGAPATVGVQDPGAGALQSIALSLRVRAPGGGDERGTGPFLDVQGGAGRTGPLVRPVVQVAVGWGFAIGSIDLAPT